MTGRRKAPKNRSTDVPAPAVAVEPEQQPQAQAVVEEGAGLSASTRSQAKQIKGKGSAPGSPTRVKVKAPQYQAGWWITPWSPPKLSSSAKNLLALSPGRRRQRPHHNETVEV